METLTSEQFRERYGRDFAFDSDEPKEKPLSSRIADSLGFGKAADVIGTEIARATAPQETRGFIEPNKPRQFAGAVAQTLSVPAAAAVTGGTSLLGQTAAGVGTGLLYDVGQGMAEGEGPKVGAATVAGGLVPPAIRGLGIMAKLGFNSAKNLIGEGIESVSDSALAQGALQKGKELVERVPRALERSKISAEEAASKAERIKNSPPVVAEALKVDLPEKYISYVYQTDEPTRAALKRVLDIAEESPNTIGVKNNPTIVGGELAAKQYDVLENHRKSIGQLMQSEEAKLAQMNVKADMRPSLSQVDGVLSQNGIRVGQDGALDFSSGKALSYTDKEKARIQELYNTVTSKNPVMSPLEVRSMDQLFSKLQREARMEDLKDIFVDVNGQNSNIYRVFRDVYSNQLDNLSPEMRNLNSQYRAIANLLEDVEDSIIKTPNFNITKSTDPAEFARVNLRRIFGEAQSSPVYEAIADKMDEVARTLGYTDASPKEIAAFAQEIRELYPESVPRTGFAGGLRSGLMDIAEKVLGAGKADVEDQRKALRALLESTSN